MRGPEKPEFDDLLLSRARLGILSALADNDLLEFTYLRDALELSDGNLGAQLRNLEDAGYIKIYKRFVDRKPRTFCRITAKGQDALHSLLKHLERVLKSPHSRDGGSN